MKEKPNDRVNLIEPAVSNPKNRNFDSLIGIYIQIYSVVQFNEWIG